MLLHALRKSLELGLLSEIKKKKTIGIKKLSVCEITCIKKMNK